ncbi:MAG: fructose-1,6-bisphosphatase [Lachnospiraceae bacterium]|nr:fructose-1,6-bisphosphatase [Lachnospiraceae bacterium]
MKQQLKMKYLKSLSNQYPNIADASTEAIHLRALLNLPKGTEHFVSDLHGEYELFLHTLRTGSGAVKGKIQDVYGNTLTAKDKSSLASLIYYPEDKLAKIKVQYDDKKDLNDWYKIMIYRMIEVCKESLSKYSRSKLRESLPKYYRRILEELLSENNRVGDKKTYYEELVDSIIHLGQADKYIISLSYLIQRLCIEHLHVIGDVFDRGPGAHIIMDELMKYHSVDFQWGNHDVVWMGAASGHLACIANVIRLSARYNNLQCIEEGYGINLIPLLHFAIDVYKDDPCTCFTIDTKNGDIESDELELNMKMHKAIAVIQFKLEGQIIMKRPDFKMNDRLLLDKIDYERGTINIQGRTYKLLDHHFPTIDPERPYELTEQEEALMERLKYSFKNCHKLQKHIRFLLSKGGLYLVYNNNLLFHGCVPLNEDGTFREVELNGMKYSGRNLYDVLEYYARKGFHRQKDDSEYYYGRDILWYIWSNENSPLYGKEKMATFERYFISEQALHEEKKDFYYQLIEEDEVVTRILKDFGLKSLDAKIINGHMPVKKGESPMKCHGRALIIDGGFSKAYHSTTGIAGYTLVFNSNELKLIAHEEFVSKEYAVEHETDIHSEIIVADYRSNRKRKKISDTDKGKGIQEKIKDLELLIDAYHSGMLEEEYE